MRAESGPLRGLNPVMGITALLVIAVFVLFGTVWTELAEGVFATVGNAIIATFKWYYIGVVAFFLLFAIFLVFSRYGDLRLGDDDRPPEFGYFAWFSMLFGAGMGIGLVFWSIAEPIFHLGGNPFLAEGEAGTLAAAETAMRLTYFHWGLHPWAIYAIVGLSLAFFCYRKKLPLAIRSVFYPLVGERIYGPIGHAVDILAVFGTVFGVATSLGLGVGQINMGLNQVFGLEVSTANQIILIAAITAIATISVVSGVGRGVKFLSEANLYMSFFILLFFLIFGPTLVVLGSFVTGLGDYLQNVVYLSFWTDPLGARDAAGWQASWTVFFWGWWIAWAPFVGIFIARISRGRTIREFIIGVLAVPTLLAMFWLTVFGGTALFMELVEGAGIAAAVAEDTTLALYATLEAISPAYLSTFIAVVATLLIVTYFITSSDSATLVVTTLLSVGDQHPPTAQRVTWGVIEGLVASVLLLAGGLGALQAASIAAALPFSIIMLFMCYGLIKGLREEKMLVLYSNSRESG